MLVVFDAIKLMILYKKKINFASVRSLRERLLWYGSQDWQYLLALHMGNPEKLCNTGFT